MAEAVFDSIPLLLVADFLDFADFRSSEPCLPNVFFFLPGDFRSSDELLPLARSLAAVAFVVVAFPRFNKVDLAFSLFNTDLTLALAEVAAVAPVVARLGVTLFPDMADFSRDVALVVLTVDLIELRPDLADGTPSEDRFGVPAIGDRFDGFETRLPPGVSMGSCTSAWTTSYCPVKRRRGV